MILFDSDDDPMYINLIALNVEDISKVIRASGTAVDVYYISKPNVVMTLNLNDESAEAFCEAVEERVNKLIEAGVIDDKLHGPRVLNNPTTAEATRAIKLE